jgi:hypothetical protein
MTINWSKEQPSPQALWQLVQKHFPGARNLGIFNPGHDDHGEGRALDIGLLVSKPDENEIAWGLIDSVLKPNQAELGWSYFIYDQWIWYSDHRGQQKGGFKGDHTNHIHVSWSQAASQKGAFPGTDTAMGAVKGKIEAMSWLKGWWKVRETVWDGSYYYYFFGPGGVVKYTKTKPSNIAVPLARADNTGRYTYASPSRLVITWNQVLGAEAACQETFDNAVSGCQQMDARSNLYSPLLATRKLS